jgi:hypothetical protein
VRPRVPSPPSQRPTIGTASSPLKGRLSMNAAPRPLSIEPEAGASSRNVILANLIAVLRGAQFSLARAVMANPQIFAGPLCTPEEYDISTKTSPAVSLTVYCLMRGQSMASALGYLSMIATLLVLRSSLLVFVNSLRSLVRNDKAIRSGMYVRKISVIAQQADLEPSFRWETVPTTGKSRHPFYALSEPDLRSQS